MWPKDRYPIAFANEQTSQENFFLLRLLHFPSQLLQEKTTHPPPEPLKNRHTHTHTHTHTHARLHRKWVEGKIEMGNVGNSRKGYSVFKFKGSVTKVRCSRWLCTSGVNSFKAFLSILLDSIYPELIFGSLFYRNFVLRDLRFTGTQMYQNSILQ